MPTGAPNPTGLPVGTYGLPNGPTRVRTEVVTDRQSLGFQAKEGQPAAGQAIVKLPIVPTGSGYKVERLDLSSTSAPGSTVAIYLSADVPQPAQDEVDYSLDGGHDIGDFNQPIYVPSGAVFTLLWSNLSPGSQVAARVQFSVVQFVAVTYQ